MVDVVAGAAMWTVECKDGEDWCCAVLGKGLNRTDKVSAVETYFLSCKITWCFPTLEWRARIAACLATFFKRSHWALLVVNSVDPEHKTSNQDASDSALASLPAMSAPVAQEGKHEPMLGSH